MQEPRRPYYRRQIEPLEKAIGAHMALHEEEYVDLKKLRIFVGTWNVNGQPAPRGPIHPWLGCDPCPPDVYAIGFQELDLSKEAYIFNDSTKEYEWLSICEASLHLKAKYKLVKVIRLIGMMLIVFVKQELRNFITNVAAETVGTGLMGRIGNKGGVAIRLDLYNTSICFINSHLAAHVEEYHRRNQDYHEICSRIIFNQFQPPRYIKDHDQVYWLGDLNYRIDDLGADEIKALIEAEAYSALLGYDQLKRQMKLFKVFDGFQEPPINYRPTYKYDPGTNEFDTSEKNRAPAWCDRVLYRGQYMQPIVYRSHPRLLLSDHKPVSCLFESTIKVIDDKRYKIVYEKVTKNLDRIENESLPQVALNKLEFTFDDVVVTEPSIDKLIVSNIGKSEVYFEFVKKEDTQRYCERWLQVSPLYGLVLPGEKKEVEFRVFIGGVDNDSSDKTNGPSSATDNSNNNCSTTTHFYDATQNLTDILILHLDRGKDFFITVNVIMQPLICI